MGESMHMTVAVIVLPLPLRRQVLWNPLRSAFLEVYTALSNPRMRHDKGRDRL